MNYKALLLVFGLSIFPYFAQAQQLPLVAQHSEYHGLINAASVNSNLLADGHNLSVGASWRQQWVQLGELSPSTKVIRAEYITDAEYQNPLVIGGYLVHDKVGITTNFGFYGRIAYIIKTGDELKDGGISLGVNIGIGNWQIRTDRLTLSQPDDPDLAFKPSSWYPDVGFGAYYFQTLRNGHYFYVGASVPRTFEFRSDDFAARRFPHYYGLFGYSIPLPLENTFMEISTWSRYVENVPLQTSFHAKIQPQEAFWFGMGVIADFKTQPLLMVETGFNLRGDFHLVKIGYSYTWGNFLSHFGATHEVNLALTMDTRGE